MTNTRKGASRGTHSGLRRGTLGWREDILIMERVNLVRTLRAQGYTASMMMGPVNELMRRRGAPEITVNTVQDHDFARIRELQAEESAASRQDEDTKIAERIESLEQIKRSAWQAFHSAGAASLNRGSYLNTIRAAEMDIAKLQRLLVDRKELSGTLRVSELAEVLDGAISDPDARLSLARQVLSQGTGGVG